MAISLKHAFTSAIAEGADATKVRTSNWNAEHVLTQATARILGRITASTGATEELTADQVRTFLDQGTAHGDSNYTILATDWFVYTSAALTAARTFTLPAANAVSAGHELLITDIAGGITSTNTLIVARAGSDTINGGTSSITLVRAYASIRLRSDGSSKWTVIACNGAYRFTSYTSGSGTHTTLAGCTEMDVEMCGGGGGGAGSGTSPGAATAGGNTTFGSLTANGGAAGTNSSGTFWALGGSASGGDVNIVGSRSAVTNGASVPGAPGGGCPLSQGGIYATYGTGASVPADGPGGAGAGAYTGASGTSTVSGGGGGGYLRKKFFPPSSSYSYAVGAAGAAASAGSSGSAGASGFAGIIYIWEKVL